MSRGEDGDEREGGASHHPFERAEPGSVLERLRRPLVAALLAGTVILGVSATAISAVSAVRAANDRDRRLAGLVTAGAASGLQAAVTVMRGADGLATDGAVSEEELSAFARDLVPGSLFPALAYAEIVPDEDRQAWEQAAGHTMKDLDLAGGLQPAAARPEHVVVRWVWPVNQTTSPVVGFDLAGDPVRAEGLAVARTAAEPRLVGPMQLVSTGRSGVFLVDAVHDARRQVIGFVSSGVGVDSLLDLPPDGTVPQDRALLLGSAVLAGDPGIGGAAEQFEAGGQSFTVRADDPKGPDWTLPIVLGSLSLLLVMAGEAARRAERRQFERQIHLGALGRRLSAAADLDAVLTIAGEQVGPVVQARRAVVGVADPRAPQGLRVRGDPGADRVLTGQLGRADADDPHPFTHCFGAGTPVLVSSRRDCQTRYPQLLAELERAGLHALLAVPLTTGAGAGEPPVGVLGLAWARRLAPTERRYILVSALVAADLVASALERVLLVAGNRDRAEQLSLLAQALAVAKAPDEIGSAVARWVPALLGATSAEVDTEGGGAATGPVGAGRVRLGPAAVGVGSLVVTWPESAAELSPAVTATLATIAELVRGANDRAEQQYQQRRVIEQLQNVLLARPEPPPALDVAVRYQPAVSTVGIGGDWYDIVRVGPSVAFLVIGDITGHGPAAVAVMAELKTVIGYLLSIDTPLEEVCRQADLYLDRHETFATMAVVRVDSDRQCVTYVNAGHPYPILVGVDGSSTTLTGAHRPLLGIVDPDPCVPAEHPFGPGDTLFVYTDGLIEDRVHTIDRAIADLAERVRERALATAPAGQLADDLLEGRNREPRATRSDDDIALLIARYRRPG